MTTYEALMLCVTIGTLVYFITADNNDKNNRP